MQNKNVKSIVCLIYVYMLVSAIWVKSNASFLLNPKLDIVLLVLCAVLTIIATILIYVFRKNIKQIDPLNIIYDPEKAFNLLWLPLLIFFFIDCQVSGIVPIAYTSLLGEQKLINVQTHTIYKSNRRNFFTCNYQLGINDHSNEFLNLCISEDFYNKFKDQQEIPTQLIVVESPLGSLITHIKVFSHG